LNAFVCNLMTSLMHRGTHRSTHSNPPLDLDLLVGQVVKTSALESRSQGFESRPERPVIFSHAIGQSTEHSQLITLRKGKFVLSDTHAELNTH